jgi:transcriptional regulator with XRE-family HTH domain
MAEETGLSARLRELIGDESERNFARIIGVSPSTLRSVLTGTRPSIDFLLAVAKAFDVSTDWLCGIEGASRQHGGQVNMRLLEAAIELVDEWLEHEDRTMDAKKKATVVTQIYQFLVDDAVEGQEPLNKARVHRILRLVA